MTAVGSLRENFIDGMYLPAGSYNDLAEKINMTTSSLIDVFSAPFFFREGSITGNVDNVEAKTFIGSLFFGSYQITGSNLLFLELQHSSDANASSTGDQFTHRIGVEIHYQYSSPSTTGSLLVLEYPTTVLRNYTVGTTDTDFKLTNFTSAHVIPFNLNSILDNPGSLYAQGTFKIMIYGSIGSTVDNVGTPLSNTLTINNIFVLNHDT